MLFGFNLKFLWSHDLRQGWAEGMDGRKILRGTLPEQGGGGSRGVKGWIWTGQDTSGQVG